MVSLSTQEYPWATRSTREQPGVPVSNQEYLELKRPILPSRVNQPGCRRRWRARRWWRREPRSRSSRTWTTTSKSLRSEEISNTQSQIVNQTKLWFFHCNYQIDSTVRLDPYLGKKQWATQQRKGLNRVGIELWNSQALGQCKMVPPVEQEPRKEYLLSGA